MAVNLRIGNKMWLETGISGALSDAGDLAATSGDQIRRRRRTAGSRSGAKERREKWRVRTIMDPNLGI